MTTARSDRSAQYAIRPDIARALDTLTEGAGDQWPNTMILRPDLEEVGTRRDAGLVALPVSPEPSSAPSSSKLQAPPLLAGTRRRRWSVSSLAHATAFSRRNDKLFPGTDGFWLSSSVRAASVGNSPHAGTTFSAQPRLHGRPGFDLMRDSGAFPRRFAQCSTVPSRIHGGVGRQEQE